MDDQLLPGEVETLDPAELYIHSDGKFGHLTNGGGVSYRSFVSEAPPDHRFDHTVEQVLAVFRRRAYVSSDRVNRRRNQRRNQTRERG